MTVGCKPRIFLSHPVAGEARGLPLSRLSWLVETGEI
jgi:hypothetical protein